jgi:CheY-like chemotaxis protein
MEPVRVMVVDDAADARFLIGLLLEEAGGFEVVGEADGGDTALALADGHLAADVALVDARMPGMTGFELVGRLREALPGLRVALLTSVVDEVVEEQAREAGADACWSKADMEDLPRRVRELAG